MKHHFRHILIINLATSDFLNALDISASGFWIVVRGQGLQEGPLCVANGFIGQLTVQGTDCAILAIALVTVYTITRHNTVGPVNASWNRSTIIRVTFAIWILPITTSCIALGMKWYEPASGSWCYIIDNPRYLRYLLTHGWRFLFFSVDIGLYTYLYLYLRNHYRKLSKMLGTELSHELADWTEKDGQTASSRFSNIKESPGSATDSSYTPPSNAKSSSSHPSFYSHINITWKTILSHRRISHTTTNESSIHEVRHRYIQHVLLLNAYPLAYMLLLIPGLANRLVEASGHTSKIMQALQASSQFVGLANALTYGWSENVAEQLRKYRSGM
ncbi:G protein-coupled glucose receptor regulating Gpa2-domain-containing protein [Crucibulum laeve]|uniref:G protein-coupled glucose receptor regulating Gpa2-domain-containing protein n=1 Tax=Crucibulum laeve TaxID=68775 RepID=A0A5C3LLH6_9AGAR|nr:G protein-coupled glucose receptor regulating Gpa2-domain-containing protein [Crucibulum laeve]